MKLVIAVVLALMAANTLAKEGCEVDLDGGLRITKTALQFTDGENIRYQILNDQTLVVNGRTLPLGQQQQQLVSQYALGIRGLVPEVRQLTLDGVDLASDAVSLVFQELLEPDNQTAKNIRTEFVLLKKDIEKNFADDRPININQKGIRDYDYLGMDFEVRINKIIDASGKELSWSILKNLGSAIFSDDKRGDFETRMNNFGARMEREMKERSTKLEKRSNLVCHSVSALDVKEEAFKQSIKEISFFNFITLKK